jgi:NAD(P)-dependent dehydrogenase (short-subunit alcohol dehydrogenase family)
MCRNAPALEALDADWNGVIDLNLNGVYRCARAFGRHMVARKSGSRGEDTKVLKLSGSLD